MDEHLLKYDDFLNEGIISDVGDKIKLYLKNLSFQKKEQFFSEFEHLPEELQNKAIDFVHLLKLKQADFSWDMLSMQNFFEDESDDEWEDEPLTIEEMRQILVREGKLTAVDSRSKSDQEIESLFNAAFHINPLH